MKKAHKKESFHSHDKLSEDKNDMHNKSYKGFSSLKKLEEIKKKYKFFPHTKEKKNIIKDKNIDYIEESNIFSKLINSMDLNLNKSNEVRNLNLTEFLPQKKRLDYYKQFSKENKQNKQNKNIGNNNIENKIKAFRYSNGSKKTQFEIWGMPEDFNYENGAFVYEPREDGKLPCNIDEIFNLSSDTDNVKTIRNNNIARQYNIQKISK